MGLSVTTWKQRAIAVRHVHFRKQSSRTGVDRLRGAHHIAEKFLAGILSELEEGAEPCANGGRVSFRHAYVNANGVGLRQNEELLRRAAISGVDQRTGIRGAPGDHAAERRINVLEGFQFLKPA